jgi:hypothetical protein
MSFWTVAQASGLQMRTLGKWGIALLTIAVFALTFYPAIDWQNSKFQAEEDAVSNVARGLASTPSDAQREGSQIEYIQLTPFSSVRVTTIISKSVTQPVSPPARSIPGGMWIVATDSSFVVRWDTLIFALSFLVVMFSAGRTLEQQRLSSASSSLSSVSGNLVSAETYLVKDVERALERSEEVFSRSTLLLIGGVLMAFVGVGIFFVALSDYSSGASIADIFLRPPASYSGILGIPGRQLFQGFRSTLMLIFIEAIAWFLLRQYRALVEDYKSFYRYYMRRANYLIVLKLASQNSDKSLEESLVKALLSEDLSGRLKRGETTENLEGQRVTDGNFAESVLTKTASVARQTLSGSRRKTT